VQVLHVVQEALSNVRKHAQATQVVLEVAKGAQWRFLVRDDGLGFSAGQAVPQSSHVGMKIMQERAHRIGATVQVQSESGKGTTMALTLPVHPVSGVNLGQLSLDAGVLSDMERDSPAGSSSM
jgi:two-component system nitrate/nitrite sensor histidine kinase NarX